MNILIENYKCIDRFDLQLNALTILAGFNSAGKSSVIEALRILRWSGQQIVCSAKSGHLQLRHDLKFIDIREPADLIRRGAEHICISGDFGEIQMTAGDSRGHGLTSISLNTNGMPEWMTSENFVYLQAERTGPRWESPLPHIENLKYCGERGEHTARRLLDVSLEFPKIALDKRCPGTRTNNFQIQIDKWMSFIFGDVSFKAKPINDSQASIIVRQPMGNFGSPAVGFGYIYALPIIIDGLAIPAGSMMLVENPEAHLHPKAQSQMGFFLGRLAAAGVKIVVETHSEHIVNGIRRASVATPGFTPNDINIYFFGEKGAEFNPQLITMDPETGDLSDFPVDFFDQVRQDMKEIWTGIHRR